MSAGNVILRLLGVWFALLLLLTLTVTSAYMPLGTLNLILNLLIAAIKALLVMVFFMHIRPGSPATIRLVASTGPLWLLLLLALTLADIFTRQPSITPW